MMNDYLIAEFVDSVDSIISQPIQQTQRIKYTAYDVSEKYIIFGASSGGLYIFNRHPCYFIQLIPSTEGAVAHLNISNDEKYIGVATIKGTLCIFHNNINNESTSSKNVQIYNEHQGNIITAMKWHHNNNELFSGDNTGKITVVIVSNLITKTMFQTPCATLMQLDSRIVQLDWSSYFLLVSTLSRVYLCDTQSEHYRQIGKKLRDGEFGACFFGTKLSYTLPSEQKPEFSSFSILNDMESFTTYDGLENIKIFCARPGARIWEVQLNGTVVRTHQFKQALIKSSTNIIKLENDCDCRLNFTSSSDASHHAFHFMKMYVLQNQFILTFQKNGLYILDPQNVAVIFWTDVFVDIIDVKVVNKCIYVWTKNHLHVLLFSILEDFIIKCLLNKNYLLCADLCISYQSYIKKILPLSKKLYLLSSLEEKLLEIDPALLEQVKPILIVIKEFCNNRQTAQKLWSGIFVVDNAHFVNNTLSDITPNLSRNNSQIFETQTEESVKNSADICCTSKQENTKFNLLLEEFELNKINSNYKTSLLHRTFQSCVKIDEIVDILKGFTVFTQDLKMPQNEIDNWCLNVCLKYVENNLSKFSIEEIQTNEYINHSFVAINTTSESCVCGFPLPNASLKPSKFPKIAQILVTYRWTTFSDLKLCHKVPYLWKEVIKLRHNDSIDTMLPLIIQYGNIEILHEFADNFDTKLRNKGVALMKDIHANEDENNRFGKLLEKSIWNKETANINFPLTITKQICFSCEMPLQSPVLCKEKYVELPCGHFLHNICYERNGHQC